MGARADRYARMDVFSEERYYRPVVEEAQLRATDRAIDIATGTGLLPMILSRIVEEAVGCDPVPQRLEVGRDKLSASDLHVEDVYGLQDDSLCDLREQIER